METYNFVDLQHSQKSQLSKVHLLEVQSCQGVAVHTHCIFEHLTDSNPENFNYKWHVFLVFPWIFLQKVTTKITSITHSMHIEKVEQLQIKKTKNVPE